MKSWRLHSLKMPQNFRKISSHVLGLFYFLTLNTHTYKNALGHFSWFSRIRSHVANIFSLSYFF